MDIPSGLIGLFGAFLVICWLFSERRHARAVVRIGLALAGMLLVTFAASRSHMADVYLQGQLLTAIRRELSSGDPRLALGAIEEYERVYESTRDATLAAAAAVEKLHATARHARAPEIPASSR
jgi:hypothetical protein